MSSRLYSVYTRAQIAEAHSRIEALGDAWNQSWGRYKEPLAGKERQRATELQIAISARLNLTSPQISALTVRQIALLVWEEQLAESSPAFFVLPNMPRPVNRYDRGEVTEPEQLQEEELRVLRAFYEGESPEEGEETLMLLERRGFLSNSPDDFGDSWAITEDGRAYLAEPEGE